MLSVLFLFCAVNLSVGKNFNVRCNNERRGMSFTPLGGEFLGRYTVELCTEVYPNYTEWETRINYYPNTTICPKDMSLGFKYRKKMHSRNVEYTQFDNNCTNVCLSKEFDLVFTSCYTVETRFLVNETGPRFTSYDFNVTSAFNIDMIKTNKPFVNSVSHDDADDSVVTITWYPGIPPTDYRVEMCDDLNSTIAEPPCSDVSCTTPDWKTIRCVVPRPDRCVHFKLTHQAPWKSGPLHPQELAPYPYCPGQGKLDDLSGNNWTVMTWALAVGCVALLAVLAQRLWQSRQAAHFKKLVQKTWVILTNNNRGTDAMAGQIESMKTSRNILLVYARENVAGQRVIDALKTVLEHNTDGQVLDIYSPLVCRLSAAAPAEWVRGVAARSDVTIVLLQTPAMHLMFGGGAEGGAFTVAAPLFPGRLVPRVPMFGDSLVQLVLRLLSATDLHHAYNRLYIANLQELPVELFPRVVPYRRYVLPRDAALLLKDTAGVEPPSPTLTGEEALITALKQGNSIGPALHGEDGLITAHREFVELVRDNPGYLVDDLVVVDEDAASRL